MFVIKAKKRTGEEKVDALRKSGETPAVFYGAGQNTTSICIPTVEFKKVWRDVGESSTVKINIGTDNIDVLIHEVQVDPITSEPIHVDFLAIDMTKKITVGVPLVFEGISNAVKTGIGNLVKALHELEVEALPADLPHDLVVDISKLQTLDDQIFVSDIRLPAGVTIVNEATDVIASIIEQVEEKEEEVPVDLTAIEVEKKGKKDEEGEEGAEAGAKDEKPE
jgi:large subunit ribosomal protein L25